MNLAALQQRIANRNAKLGVIGLGYVGLPVAGRSHIDDREPGLADSLTIRPLRRDTHKRGRASESVIQQYLKTGRPMYLEFVEPSKRYADVIIPEGGFEMVAARIRGLLGE